MAFQISSALTLELIPSWIHTRSDPWKLNSVFQIYFLLVFIFKSVVLFASRSDFYSHFSVFSIQLFPSWSLRFDNFIAGYDDIWCVRSIEIDGFGDLSYLIVGSFFIFWGMHSGFNFFYAVIMGGFFNSGVFFFSTYFGKVFFFFN